MSFFLLHWASCSTCCWCGIEEQGIKGIAPAMAEGKRPFGASSLIAGFLFIYFLSYLVMPLNMKQHSYTWASFRLANLGNKFGEGAAAGTWHTLRGGSESLFGQGRVVVPAIPGPLWPLPELAGLEEDECTCFCHTPSSFAVQTDPQCPHGEEANT